MKNLYLLLISLLSISLSFAQSPSVSNKAVKVQPIAIQKEAMQIAKKANFLKNTMLNSDQITATPLQDISAFRVPAPDKTVLKASQDLSTKYDRPVSSFIAGFEEVRDDKGETFIDFTSPTIFMPALRDNYFYPASTISTATFSWSARNWNTGQTASFADITEADGSLNYYATPLSEHSVFPYTPILTAKAGNATATYQWGTTYTYWDDNDQKQVTTISQQNIITSSPAIRALTYADFWEGGAYGGINATKYFGSNYKVNNVACTGIMSVFQKPAAPLYIESIDAVAFPYQTNDLLQMIPAGKSLTLKICPITVNSQGEGVIGDPVATTTATQADIIPAGELGLIHFQFLEQDGEFVTPKPQIVNDAFAVIIKGFDATYDIRFLFSSNQSVYGAGSAYTLHDDNISMFTWKDLDPNIAPAYSNVVALDLYTQLNGTFNNLEWGDGLNHAIADVAGGNVVTWSEEDQQTYANFFYSTFDLESVYVLEKDDWMEVELDDSQYATEGGYRLVATAEPLPAGLTGRNGKIVLASRGVTATLYVIQGDAEWPNSISSTLLVEAPKASRQGDNFVLSYPATLTSVSVYNITGQKVAEKTLSASGTDVLPAAHLANGVYILKFNGTNLTAKIIK